MKIVTALLCSGLATVLLSCSADDSSVGSEYYELFGVSDSAELVRLQYRELADLEESVSACMKAAGHQYEPVSYREIEELAVARPAVRDVDYVEAHGFGLADAHLAGSGGLESSNAVSFARLTPSERDAFVRDLTGSGEDELMAHYEPSASADVHHTWVMVTAQSAPGGCIGSAVDGLTWFSVVAANAEQLGAMNAVVVGDPSYLELVDDWRSCMAERGYAYQSPDDAESDIEQRLAAVNPASIQGDGGSDASSEDEAEIESRIREIRAEELAIADADLGCGRADIDQRVIEVSQDAADDIWGGDG